MQQQLAAQLAPLPTRDTPLSCSRAVETKLYAFLTSTLDHRATNRLQPTWPTLADVTDAVPRCLSTSHQKWTLSCQRKPLSKFRYKLGAFRYTNCDFRQNQ